MAYWLVKSEPFKYSWQQFVADRITFWDGVRNFLARNNLRTMKKGDRVFFYHSNEGKDIVGIASVVEEAVQDPTTTDANWVGVTLKAERPLKKSVSLSTIKSMPALANMELVQLQRLSVSAVTEEEWHIILELSK